MLLFHAGHLGGGFLGVDLFFALSGYLITDLLLRELRETGTVSLTAFWARRIRRLLPALVLLLVGVTVLTWALGETDMWRSALADGPWVQANLVNWHLLGESSDYWAGLGSGSAFGHLWSIAVEEQFYLIWPIVLLLVARRGRSVENHENRLAWIAILASVGSLALMLLLLDPQDTTRVYTGTDTRAFSLMLGALLATGPARRLLTRLVAGRTDLALVLLFAGMAATWVLAEGESSVWLFQGGLFAHSLASALVVALCAGAPDSGTARVLGWRPLRWLGLISYSVYLWHWPVFLLLSEQRLGLDGWARTGIVCLTSIGVAALSKLLVEDPIRFRAGWARGRTGLAAFVAIMTALAVFWAAMPRPAVQQVDAGTVSTEQRQRSDHASEGSDSGSGTGPRLSRVLLMGDSIALGLALPLDAAADASGITLKSVASDGGGGVVGPLAQSTWDDLPAVIDSFRPDVVVYQLTTYDWGTRGEQRAGYQRLVEKAAAHGARVAFVPFPPIRPNEFYRPHMAELDRAPEVARDVAAASDGDAMFLDSAAVWGETYRRNRDGNPDRSEDGIHTCQQGAARFTSWLLDELAARSSGFTPAEPRAWVDGGWAEDARFKGC